MSEWITSKQLGQAAPHFLEENVQAADLWHAIEGLMDGVDGDPRLEEHLADQLQDLGGILDRAEQAWNGADAENRDSLPEISKALRGLDEAHAALGRELSEDAAEV